MKRADHSLIKSILSLLEFLQANHIELEKFLERGGEEMLPANQDFYTARSILKFMDEIPGGFLIYRADGGEEIIYANKGLLRIFQCRSLKELKEYTHNSFTGLVHPEDLAAVEQSIREQISVSQYKLDSVEYRIIRKDGTVRWIEDYGHFIRSGGKSIFYVFLGDATEKRNQHLLEKAFLVSEKKKNEQKLQEVINEYAQERASINQEYLRRLEVIEGLSTNYDSILYGDLDKDAIFPYRLSSRTQLQFGEKFQMRSFSWYIADYTAVWVHPEDQEMVLRMLEPSYIRAKLSTNKSYYFNYKVIEAGETRYLQLRIVNVGPRDTVSQIVLGYRRVDEEIQREMEQKQMLADTLSNANQAISAKNTFLSNMSHDMRTPLNAIFGFTALAKKNLHDAETVHSYLERIEASSHQLLDMIEKVLGITHAGSGEARAMEQECDLCKEVKEIYDFLYPQAVEKNLDFSLDCSDVVHSAVYSDPEKLKQLILYLANNAVTYTPPGGRVSILVKELAQLPNCYAAFQLTVTDNGVGISEEFLSRIFEPFTREKNTTLSGIHGIGLGLAIAKNIVDLMGGTIDVKSAAGQGSTFTASFRFRIQECSVPQSCSPAPSGSLTSQKLLLVEDNRINQEIESEILQDLGFTVEIAADGRIAVDKITCSAPNEYGLILMDIQMPVMDGWQAAKAIRALDNSAQANIPIIALSANVFESDVRTSMESGMNAHLPKPLDVSQLLSTIENLRAGK